MLTYGVNVERGMELSFDYRGNANRPAGVSNVLYFRHELKGTALSFLHTIDPYWCCLSPAYTLFYKALSTIHNMTGKIRMLTLLATHFTKLSLQILLTM